MQKFFDTLIIFAPLILIFMLVFLSIFNQDFKALIFILGLSISLYIFKISSPVVYKEDSVYCNLFKLYGIEVHGPLVYAFIFIMFFLPMMINENYNFLLLIFIAILSFIDIIYRILNCLTKSGSDSGNASFLKNLFTTILLPLFIGLTSGILWFFLIYYIDPRGNVLYLDSVRNNKAQCKHTKTNEYTCSSSDS